MTPSSLMTSPYCYFLVTLKVEAKAAEGKSSSCELCCTLLRGWSLGADDKWGQSSPEILLLLTTALNWCQDPLLLQQLWKIKLLIPEKSSFPVASSAMQTPIFVLSGMQRQHHCLASLQPFFLAGCLPFSSEGSRHPFSLKWMNKSKQTTYWSLRHPFAARDVCTIYLFASFPAQSHLVMCLFIFQI